MRPVLFALGIALTAGCAGTGAGKSAPTANPEPKAPAPEAPEADGGQAPAEPAAIPEEAVLQALPGTWENRSCAERKYPRIVHFQEGGSFLAEDAVAPCPEGSNCVLPGVINWRGNWRVEGRVIQIEVVPIEGAKAPERTPTDFVILSGSPFSIGERNDKLVCPFQKRQ